MPAILERLVKQLKAKGKSTSSAFAIATSALQKSGNLKKGTQKATPQGKRRGSMTPSERAKNRAVKYSKNKHKKGDYSYSVKTNRVRIK